MGADDRQRPDRIIATRKLLQQNSTQRTWLLSIIAVIASVRILGYVASFGSNVPIADDWDLLRTLVAWRTGDFSLSSLFAFHNEHRIVASRLIESVVLPLVDGNLKVVLLLNAVFVAFTVALTLSILRRARSHGFFIATAAIVTASLMTGWFQWQNLLWSFQIPWLLIPLLVVAAIWCLIFVKNDAACAALVFLLLVAALGCQANGIVAFLAVLPAWMIRIRTASWKKRAVCLGGAAFMIVLAAFVYTLGMPAYIARPHLGSIAHHPLRFTHFFLATLGSPFTAALSLAGPERWLGLVIGTCAALIAVASLPAVVRHARMRTQPEVLALGLGLMILGSVSVVAISVGRFEMFSPDQIESRYSTFAACFHAGLLLTLFAIVTVDRPVGPRTGTLRLAFLGLCAALFIGSVWGDAALSRQGANLQGAVLRLKAMLNVEQALPEQADLQSAVHTVPLTAVPALLRSLESHRLWTPAIMGSRPASDIRRGAEVGNVDAIVLDSGQVVMQGWARLPDNRPADAILALSTDGRGNVTPVAISTKERSGRPDIRAKYGDESLISAGWTVRIDQGDFDRHPILVAYSAKDDRLYDIAYAWRTVP